MGNPSSLKVYIPVWPEDRKPREEDGWSYAFTDFRFSCIAFDWYVREEGSDNFGDFAGMRGRLENQEKRKSKG